MPLNPAQQQELSELRRLEELEQKFGKSEVPAQQEGPGAAQSAIEKFADSATFGYLPQLQAGAGSAMGLGKYTDLRDENIDRLKQEGSKHKLASTIGTVAGFGPSMFIPGAGTAKGIAGVAKVAGIGGLQGLLSNPGDTKGEVNPIQIGDRLKHGAVGAVLGAGGQLASNALAKTGDYVMQKALGMKHYEPGLGTKFADEGLVGTKGMMSKQVGNKMGEVGDEIGELAKSLEGVSSDTASQHILDRAMKYIQKDGHVSPDDMPKFKKLMELAEEVSGRGGEAGSIAGDVAAGARASAGKRGREAGAFKMDPSQSLKAEAARAEQGGWSKSLKEGFSKANPGAPNALAKADSRYGTLAKANQSLSRPESIPQSLGALLFKGGIGAGAGYAIDGTPGAIAGAAVTSPAGMSTIGQTATKNAKLLQFLAPAIRQSILNSSQEE